MIPLLLGVALAHAPNTSLSTITPTPGGAAVVLTLRARDAATLGPLDPVPLVPLAGDAPCTGGAPRVTTRPDTRVQARWTVECPAPVDGVDATALVSALPRHLHLTRLGDREAGLTAAAPRLVPDAPPTGLVRSGAQHLLEGWDHVAFIALLALLPATLGGLAWAVSGFTLGHSVALLLAGLGLVAPVGVEVLIAWSIAALAAETTWLHEGRRRDALAVLLALSPLPLAALPAGPPLLAVAGATLFMGCHLALLRRSDRPLRARLRTTAFFGLLHGFGFAGALTAIDRAGADLVRGVLGFNLGVEVGQIAALVVLAPALALLRRLAPDGVPRVGAALGVAAGVAALVARATLH